MRIIRLYHPEKLNCGENTFLTADASNHVVRALRSKIYSAVTLFNGDGFDYQCKTLDVNNKKTQVSVESKLANNNESNLDITLLQGLARQDRMETTIQKSVELGVNKIIPVICQRSNLKSNKDKLSKKLSYWRKIAISACEQSGRSKIPEITDVILFNAIKQSLNHDTFKITLDPVATTSLNKLKQKHNKIPHAAMSIFIGPEGGLNDDEIKLLTDESFNGICYGPRILRTETTGPAIISALQILWGDC